MENAEPAKIKRGAVRSDGAKVVGTGGVTEGLVDSTKKLGFIQWTTGTC